MSDEDDTRIGYLAGGADGSLVAGERAGLDELRALLGSPALWVQPLASLEDNVVAAVVHAVQVRATASRTLNRGGRRRVGWSRLAFAVAGALAAALVGIVLTVGGKRAAPERLAMVVFGTALAPRAHGTATLTRTPSGWEIHLTVAGLPHIGGGGYYEGWLQDTASDRVAIGTFNDARNVTLWAGVSPTAFTTLTVTVQRSGAGTAESEARILVGAAGTGTHHGP
jgi:Anti-sigma-K factor rskA, C-terminal